MRIALTGATGFSGPLILQALLEQGHEVAALARRPEALAGQKLQIVAGDLADETALATLVKDTDAVLHVAGATSARNRLGYFRVNLEGTRKLYAVARRAGVKRFVFVSSLAAREPSLSSYGASKAAAEHFLLGQAGGMEMLVLRAPAIYGPGDRATLQLIKAMQAKTAFIPGHKHSRFAILHVKDFARIAAESVSASRTGLIELDDCNGSYDWNMLAAEHRRITGMPERVIFIPKLVAFAAAAAVEGYSRLTNKPSMTNTGKVNELYHRDWSAQAESWPRENAIGLAQGLAETLTWYRQHGWLPPLPQQTRSQT
jgi:nucleoside-diphosphate-sugar epimerase